MNTTISLIVSAVMVFLLLVTHLAADMGRKAAKDIIDSRNTPPEE